MGLSLQLCAQGLDKQKVFCLTLRCRQPSGLDVTQFPCRQQTKKQHDGQPDAPCQRLRHALSLGFFIVARAQHEKQGSAQRGQDGQEGKGNEPCHGAHYPVNTEQTKATPLRFWLLALAALAGVVVTASLGSWQLDRAAQKEALQAAIDQQARLPVLDGKSLTLGSEVVGAGDALGPDEAALVHRRVALSGHWLPSYSVFLDNRQMNGHPGFFVLTPLQLQNSPAVVLVQRGWAARNFQERTTLPAVDTPAGLVQLQGRVAAPPSKLMELATSTQAPGFSRIRQNLDMGAFRAETGLALTRLTVLQTGAASEGLLREWPAVRSGVEKHYGYAFQWFGLSGLIAFLYVWFQLVRPVLRERRVSRSRF